MKYGLPYKGSKNKLAERIVRLLPRAEHLIDLFCGGCAVAHAAIEMGKYPHIHINDVNWMCPQLFTDALAGRYADDTRWISRDDFFRLKDSDPYVAFVWSFGNNLRDYLYSRDIEPLKRAFHYAIFYADYQPALDLGIDLRALDGITGYERRYAAMRSIVKKITPPTEPTRKPRTLLASMPESTKFSTSSNMPEYRSQKKKTFSGWHIWSGNSDPRSVRAIPHAEHREPAAVQNYTPPLSPVSSQAQRLIMSKSAYPKAA